MVCVCPRTHSVRTNICTSRGWPRLTSLRKLEHANDMFNWPLSSLPFCTSTFVFRLGQTIWMNFFFSSSSLFSSVYFSRKTLPRVLSTCAMLCQTQWPLLTLLLVWAECVHYAPQNAVATINTVIFSLSCVYFSPIRTLPRVMNFCIQTYIAPKRWKMQMVIPPKKLWFI